MTTQKKSPTVATPGSARRPADILPRPRLDDEPPLLTDKDCHFEQDDRDDFDPREPEVEPELEPDVPPPEYETAPQCDPRPDPDVFFDDKPRDDHGAPTLRLVAECEDSIDDVISSIKSLPDEAGASEVGAILDKAAPVLGGLVGIALEINRDRLIVAIGDRVKAPARIVDAALSAKPPPPTSASGPKKNKALPKDNRRDIVLLAGKEHLAVEAGTVAIARDQSIYQRSGSLVTIRQWEAGDQDRRGIERTPGAPIIDRLTEISLWTRLSANAKFSKWVAKGRGDNRVEELAPVNTPRDIASAIHGMKYWPGVRELLGVTSAPLIHRDGTVNTRPGYDPETGYFYAPSGVAPIVTASPTRDDAVQARVTLLDLVADFPFHRGETGPDGWLALLLTVLTRHLIQVVLQFFIEASTAGTGKTLLAELVAYIALGVSAPRSPVPPDDNELRKRLLAHGLAGDTYVLIDNVPNGSSFGWSALDMAATAPTIRDRLLGGNELAEVKNNLTIVATGNNIAIRGDTGRRTICIRLETDLENPEDRGGFRIDNIRRYAQDNRPELLGAALTILSSYLRAGSPSVGVRPLGSFEQWSDLVRSAIIWAGGRDPVDLLASKNADADPYTAAHIALMDAWPEPLTAAGAIAIAKKTPDGSLDRALREVCGGREPTASKLGYRLRSLRGRRRRLESGDLGSFSAEPSKGKTLKWEVTTTAQDATQSGNKGGDEAIGGIDPTSSAKTGRVEHPQGGVDSEHVSGGELESSPSSPHHPTQQDWVAFEDEIDEVEL